ncbi:hypothetical protein [Saccharopolyspora sp. SCSIO 74807]|uniref:hypothetical protein n=1 Tax=Saccharopolyspora sp. SCSIO 74807 TaxID=3118084 RepID=UPI0030CE7660
MSHLDADEVLEAARQQAAGGRVRSADHLRECARCADGVAAMARLTAAGEVLAAEEDRELAVPSFEHVRAALPGNQARTGPQREPAPRGAPERRGKQLLRLTAALVWAQLALLPRLLLPASAFAFAAAVVLATALPESSAGLREHAFGAAVVLIVLAGSLTTYSGGRDPRTELQFSLPIAPPTVFVCRVVGVLGLDVLLAVLGSVAVHVFGGSPSLAGVLASWFGQALLTVGVALVFAVAHAPATGTLAGVLVWLLGSSSGLPEAGGLGGILRPAVSTLWTSSPAVVALALALLAIAVLGMRFPRFGPRREGS